MVMKQLFADFFKDNVPDYYRNIKEALNAIVGCKQQYSYGPDGIP